MRTIVGFGMALLLFIALSGQARVATAGEAESALEEANTALLARPPARDAARRALERATAAEDQGAASQAYYRLGILDEEEQEFTRALTRYRQCVAAKPSSSGGHWPRNASKRMQWLKAHSEGNFAPLTRLQRFTRDPALLADAEAVDAFARDTEAFPPGLVRSEARAFVASAWLGPLRRPHDAARVFRTVATDLTAEPGTLVVAERGLVDALIADGQLDEAEHEVQLHRTQLDVEVVTRLQQLLRRRGTLRAARIALEAFAGLAVIALVYARWKQGSVREALRVTRTPARVAGALWCAASTIAAAVVLLGVLAPTYLERIGL